MRTLVYVDTDTCRWHIDLLKQPDITQIRDIEEFKQTQEENKVALFHMPFPYVDGFDQKIKDTLPYCNRIAVIGSELHAETVEHIQFNQNPKIQYFICGFIDHIQTQIWMDWFVTSSHIYKTSKVLDQLIPSDAKPKFFDILLGQPKPHRTFIHNWINQNNHGDKVVMTYLVDHSKPIQKQDQYSWVWGVDGIVKPTTDFNWTVTEVNYQGHRMSLSQVIPIDIYNQTAYTVIAETNYENHYTFFTEKTVKPILAQRLFVAIAGQHYLKNLRELGFKTFDGIIDESYDLIEDNTKRWSAAIEQIDYLFSQPQHVILENIKPIVEHNRKVMLETDWYGQFQHALKEYFKI